VPPSGCNRSFFPFYHTGKENARDSKKLLAETMLPLLLPGASCSEIWFGYAAAICKKALLFL